jgi:DNA-binding transcriptional regulator YhcF (GntR family)
MARPSKFEEHRDVVLVFIHNAASRHSRPPTVRTLAEVVGVGVATMHSYLGKLAEEGLVEWQPRSHRSVRCTQAGIQHVSSRAVQPI